MHKHTITHADVSLFWLAEGALIDSRLVVAPAEVRLRSVFKISCLFLRPRPWQFEI